MKVIRFIICYLLLGHTASLVAADTGDSRTDERNRIVVLARFQNDPDFEEPQSYYEEFFNGPGEMSVQSYFKALSNGKLKINSSIFPMNEPTSSEHSYELKYCFYCYDSDWSKSFPECKGKDISAGLADVSIGFIIRELAEKITSQVDGNLYDRDADGYIDDFVMVFRGGSRGTDKGVHSPQNGELSERFINANGDIELGGKKIKKYTILYERSSLATHCRFLLNELGFPYLYRFRSEYPRPVGMWDVMDGPELTLPLVYNRWKYSGGTWVEDIPAIRSHATYTLNSADKPEKNAYKILTDDPTEFFVLEYSNNQNAYERHLPESGLLIYRVHTDKNGSTEPVPEFYVFRKDGEIDQAGDLNEALFSDINGRNIFSAASNPYPFISNGDRADIAISDIKIEGETLTFTTGDLPSSVEEITSSKQLKLYYAPDTKNLSISGDWEHVSIKNLSGIDLLTEQNTSGDYSQSISLQEYPKGVYLIVVNKDGHNETMKIVL